MRLRTLITGAVFALTLAGCAGLPNGMTVGEYCANPDKADEAVCQLKVEIDGNSTTLAETNMSLSKARRMADDAMSAAQSAQASANSAQDTANRALSLGRSAMLKEEDLICKTSVIQKSDIGTCEPGYTVMGCAQTRFTTRAGGMSFLREINNEQCRFNSKVLEMNVRCCMTAPVQKSMSGPAG